jgi:hypothetical protein
VRVATVAWAIRVAAARVTCCVFINLFVITLVTGNVRTIICKWNQSRLHMCKQHFFNIKDVFAFTDIGNQWTVFHFWQKYFSGLNLILVFNISFLGQSNPFHINRAFVSTENFEKFEERIILWVFAARTAGQLMKINNERLEHQNVLAKLREWSNKLSTVMCLKVRYRKCEIGDYIKTLVM